MNVLSKEIAERFPLNGNPKPARVRVEFHAGKAYGTKVLELWKKQSLQESLTHLVVWSFQ